MTPYYLQMEDAYLPMFGDDSILGRSVVLHESDGDRYSCASLLEDREAYVKIVANFSSTLCGSIVIQQTRGDGSEDATILVDVAKCDSGASIPASVDFYLGADTMRRHGRNLQTSCTVPMLFNPFKLI